MAEDAKTTLLSHGDMEKILTGVKEYIDKQVEDTNKSLDELEKKIGSIGSVERFAIGERLFTDGVAEGDTLYLTNARVVDGEEEDEQILIINN